MTSTTRAAHEFAVTVRHVDTCLGCYLTDHHNREGEALLGVSVDRASRIHHVRAALLDEAIMLEHRDDTPPREAVAAAIAAAFKGAHPLKSFDASLDATPDDFEGECVSAWFVITWQPAPADDLPSAETIAPRPAMVAQPVQQQQADASAFDGATHAEAASWLGYVSAHAADARDVAAFDAAVTEAVDTLLRRLSITPLVARCLLRFFDAPHSAVIGATVSAARMVAQPCQQQQGRGRPTLAVACAQYVHRFTCDHVPAWARQVREDGSFYAPHFASDAEWYAATRFPGEAGIHGNTRSCQTGPATWPHGKALAEPYRPGVTPRPFMVPQVSQQQQARHSAPPAIGPSLYEALGGLGVRVGRGLGLKPAWLAKLPWSAPVVIEIDYEKSREPAAPCIIPDFDPWATR